MSMGIKIEMMIRWMGRAVFLILESPVIRLDSKPVFFLMHPVLPILIWQVMRNYSPSEHSGPFVVKKLRSTLAINILLSKHFVAGSTATITADISLRNIIIIRRW